MSLSKFVARVAGILAVVPLGLAASAQDLGNPGAAEPPSPQAVDSSSQGRFTIFPLTSAAPSVPTPATEMAIPPESPLSAGKTPSREYMWILENVTERYPDGKIKVERQVTQDASGNYINHGTYTMYDPEGKILRTGEYQNGKQHGKWTQRMDRDEGYLFSSAQENAFPGPFTSEATFLDGQLQGTWTIKDRNGQDIVEWNFDHGVGQGLWTWRYPNGEKRTEAHYSNGVLDGELVEWGHDGKQISQSTYVDGRCIVKNIGWYGPGQKHYEGQFLRVQEMPVLSYDWWTSTAKPAAAIPAGKDQKHSLWTAWYRNGNKSCEGQFDRDVPIGKYTWWYPNGQKQAEAEYQNGLKSGVWITWHSNGQRESEGEFKDGVLVSKWTHWDLDGKVVEVQNPGSAIPQAAVQIAFPQSEKVAHQRMSRAEAESTRDE